MNNQQKQGKQDKKEQEGGVVGQQDVYYIKRPNKNLFNKMKFKESFGMENMQNYNPLYSTIFALNKTNYNSVVLNHEYYISDILSKQSENVYVCKLQNVSDYVKPTKASVFMKIIPLIDPDKYITGQYGSIPTDSLFELPSLDEPTHANQKLKMKVTTHATNNAAYVDNYFAFLTNILYKYGFVHGLNYYGSYVGHKLNYKHNIADSFDILNKNKAFHTNMNKLFTMDDVSYLYQYPVSINNHVNQPLTLCSHASSINADLFDDLDVGGGGDEPTLGGEPVVTEEVPELELVEITMDEEQNVMECDNDNDNGSTTSSSDSSRTSHTTMGSRATTATTVSSLSGGGSDTSWQTMSGSGGSGTGTGTGSTSSSMSSELDDIMITIPKFPVQLVCMEKFENTVEHLMLKNGLDSDEKWLSMLMQVIMNLLTYQRIFDFTHNDLHIGNVMYMQTQKQHLYYVYGGKTYKVPTFGYIYKIIDFGRAIYKTKHMGMGVGETGETLYVSDSFRPSGDAHSQYNFEPYFNPNKPRVEPNPSFDLTRFACSIFDYIMMDDDNMSICNIETIEGCEDPIKRLIATWCLDDKGKNILYKASGVDRYPEFKLYKMIARIVHLHSPDAQLERPEFKGFIVNADLSNKNIRKKIINHGGLIMDLDGLINRFK